MTDAQRGVDAGVGLLRPEREVDRNAAYRVALMR